MRMAGYRNGQFERLTSGLRLPVLGAPMFIASCPDLVVAQCTSGIIGSMPALNARPSAQLDEWLAEINERLAAWNTANPQRPAAPFAINQIVHKTNPRLEADMALCAKHKVPIIISSLGAREDVNQAVHGWGGITLHDIIDDRFARKAVEKGADGLIAVAAGAGGHAGEQSPFALVQEIRRWFDGPLALSGAIATGASILAAQAMGADLAYIGSAFLATDEAHVSATQKQAMLEASAADIVYTDYFTGVRGNYLRASIVASGLDPENLPKPADAPDIGAKIGAKEGESKAWRDIWGCGQGVGAVDEIVPAAALVARLEAEYGATVQSLGRRVRAFAPG